jgi:HEAT repeat protein
MQRKSFRNGLPLFLLIGALVSPALADENRASGARALRLLQQAMQDESSDVRALAAERWGPLKNPAAKALLRKALKDDSLYVRIAAAGSLYELGDRSGVKVLDKIVRTVPAKPASGGALAALEELRMIAKNKMRARAVRALGLMRGNNIRTILRRAYKDSDGSVRDAAAIALARQGDGAPLNDFVEALEFRDYRVRTKAVESLAAVATEKIVDLVAPLANDGDPGVRAAVMTALGASGSARAVKPLIAGLKDPHERVRVKAIAALGRIPNKQAVPPLREQYEQAKDNGFIRMVAAASLASQGEPVDLMVAQLALQKSTDVDARTLAVETLETVGGNESIRLLEEALNDKDMSVRVRAAAALVQLLQKKN